MVTTTWPFDDPYVARRMLELGVVCGALADLAGYDPFTLRVAASARMADRAPDARLAYATERITTIAACTGASPGAIAVLAATVPDDATVADAATVARLLLAAPDDAQAREWVRHQPDPATTERARSLGWPDLALQLLDEAAAPA